MSKSHLWAHGVAGRLDRTLKQSLAEGFKTCKMKSQAVTRRAVVCGDSTGHHSSPAIELL
jgi:hypothetical protein